MVVGGFQLGWQGADGHCASGTVKKCNISLKSFLILPKPESGGVTLVLPDLCFNQKPIYEQHLQHRFNLRHQSLSATKPERLCPDPEGFSSHRFCLAIRQFDRCAERVVHVSTGLVGCSQLNHEPALRQKQPGQHGFSKPGLRHSIG